MLQLLALGAPAREVAVSVEASALLPLACEGEVRLTPSQWLERWKSQHTGTDTFKPASHPGLLPQPRVALLQLCQWPNRTTVGGCCATTVPLTLDLTAAAAPRVDHTIAHH